MFHSKGTAHAKTRRERGTLGSGNWLCDAPDTERIKVAFLRMAFEVLQVQAPDSPPDSCPDTHHTAVTEPMNSLLYVILSLASCSIWWRIRSRIQ